MDSRSYTSRIVCELGSRRQNERHASILFHEPKRCKNERIPSISAVANWVSVKIAYVSRRSLKANSQSLNRNKRWISNNSIKTPTSLLGPFQEINTPDCCCQAVSWRTYRIKIDGEDTTLGYAKLG